MLTWNKNKIQILKAYLEGGLLTKDIAVKLKMSPDSIDGAIRRYNLGKFKKIEELPVLDLDELNDKDFDEQKEAAKLQWKIPVSKLPANGKKNFKTYVVVTDVHVPEQNMAAVNCVLQVMIFPFTVKCNSPSFSSKSLHLYPIAFS